MGPSAAPPTPRSRTLVAAAVPVSRCPPPATTGTLLLLRVPLAAHCNYHPKSAAELAEVFVAERVLQVQNFEGFKPAREP